MAPDTKFRAVALLDRDGTINEEVEYLSAANQLRLIPGAARAIRVLNQENIAAVLTTNQSGIARGMFTEERLGEIHERLKRMLADEDARLDGIYHCPSMPDSGDPRRKPAPGMYEEAKKELGLEGLPAFSIGDRALDVEFGLNCGGKGIRVLTGHQLKSDVPYDYKLLHEKHTRGKTFVAENLIQAVYLLLADLIKEEAHSDRLFLEKFADLYSTSESVRHEKRRGNRVVLANGCFDLLHGGHVSYLESCKAAGDRLVLAVNSNASIRRLKGVGRPIFSEVDRLVTLANLHCIDYLTIFHMDSADHALETIHPDIHAKGTDYRSDNVPELQTSRRLGIETRIVGDPKENSTRDIIEVVAERARRGVL